MNLRFPARRITAGSLVACAVAVGLATRGVSPHLEHVAAQDEGPAASEARRLESAFARVAERVSPSVVSIRVEAPLEPSDLQPLLGWVLGEPPGGRVLEGGASGFVVHEAGAILTNHHVVERATRIRVRLGDGRELPGTVIGIDPATDLALIRVPARGLRPLRFADVARARVGDSVLAIGAPLGLETTVTTGVLSAIGRSGFGLSDIEDYVQTDASIHVGSSGGPLVDLEGNVVGVTTVVIGGAPGLSFAVSAELAAPVTRQLVAEGRVRRSWIGFEHQDLTPDLAVALGAGAETRGSLVSAITEDGPAQRAGLEVGDAITAIDGAPLAERLDL
ncbi:MAG: S1C family serine protease, partial [Myxococcota bacterium]|nr:S1C family serine protease [Myxococcota bacterium]